MRSINTNQTSKKIFASILLLAIKFYRLDLPRATHATLASITRLKWPHAKAAMLDFSAMKKQWLIKNLVSPVRIKMSKSRRSARIARWVTIAQQKISLNRFSVLPDGLQHPLGKFLASNAMMDSRKIKKFQLKRALWDARLLNMGLVFRYFFRNIIFGNGKPWVVLNQNKKIKKWLPEQYHLKSTKSFKCFRPMVTTSMAEEFALIHLWFPKSKICMILLINIIKISK